MIKLFYHHKIIKEACGNVASFHVQLILQFIGHIPHVSTRYIYIYFRPVLSPDVYVYAWHAICIKNNAVACRLIMHASEATVHALYILI